MSVLEQTHRHLGWPSPAEIHEPPGVGARVQAELARRKLGGAIARMEENLTVEVGILTRDPSARVTETPIAVVCEFQRAVSPATLREAHRLAWNFCRTPLLITLEPHLIRAWTCCEPPPEPGNSESLPGEIEDSRLDVQQESSFSEQAAQSLHWIELASGHFFERRKDRFRRDQCADQFLLDNLRAVRGALLGKGLNDDVCHDLLARLIFIQFLFDRKDSTGNAALNTKRLSALHKDGILSQSYESLELILKNYDDSYALFRWLNEIFNGDLFPGSGGTPTEREEALNAEKAMVTADHLSTLAGFVAGSLDLASRQRLLWREYRFDVIPLEFISSIYEEFVSKKNRSTDSESPTRPAASTGTVYTRPYLVDFILDEILPWDSKAWDVKILDPACGSGIFLVKAYQRLVQRWKRAHEAEPKAADLRQLLEENLLGVDKDPHAVRVASFSLYLAMCDEIDPRFYWTKVKFPPLRQRRLICADFFSESTVGISTEQDKETYDVVVGNAPWGRDTIGDSDVNSWVRQGWEANYNNIGPLFLPKAAVLCKADGVVSMLQPAGLLTHDSGTATRFRRKLFETFRVEEIVNLSALRFGLFATAIGPACIITFRPKPPDGEPFAYLCPKELHTTDDDYRVVVEPQDVHFVSPLEAASVRTIWTALMWGGPRDSVLIRRLENGATLDGLLRRGLIKKRQGLNRGNRKREDRETLDRPILNATTFPEGTFQRLDASKLPTNDEPHVDSAASTDYSAFTLPQILLKQGWQQEEGRFRAAIVEWADRNGRGVLCSKSYVSMHADEEHRHLLDSIWLAFNSCCTIYYLFLTSSRFASYRPEVNVGDLMKVPLPAEARIRLDDLKSWEDVDDRARRAFGFKDSEWLLIEDLFRYTLPDFKAGDRSPGRQPTSRHDASRREIPAENMLAQYCEHFRKVLKAAFGEQRKIGATIYQEHNGSALPLRLVAIHLDWPQDGEIRIEQIDLMRLRPQLLSLATKVPGSPDARGNGAFFRRVWRVYDSVVVGSSRIPTVYLIKPDWQRYWTRSMALRDADDVAVDIVHWQSEIEQGIVEE